MDFSLLSPTENFSLKPYLNAIRVELTSMGFTFEIKQRIKVIQTPIESAFIKGETKVNLLVIDAPPALRAKLPGPKEFYGLVYERKRV